VLGIQEVLVGTVQMVAVNNVMINTFLSRV